MYVRVCACVGQTWLSYARGFPRGPKTKSFVCFRKNRKKEKQRSTGRQPRQPAQLSLKCICSATPPPPSRRPTRRRPPCLCCSRRFGSSVHGRDPSSVASRRFSAPAARRRPRRHIRSVHKLRLLPVSPARKRPRCRRLQRFAARRLFRTARCVSAWSTCSTDPAGMTPSSPRPATSEALHTSSSTSSQASRGASRCLPGSFRCRITALGCQMAAQLPSDASPGCGDRGGGKRLAGGSAQPSRRADTRASGRCVRRRRSHHCCCC